MVRRSGIVSGSVSGNVSGVARGVVSGTGSRIRRTAGRALSAWALSGWALISLTATVGAQASGGASSASPREGVIIGGTAAPKLERCIDVEIGGDHAFGCLNQQLRREVDRVNPSLNLPPLDARSPDVRVGNVNEAAVRQQYGSNYGRSVFPFRPPA